MGRLIANDPITGVREDFHTEGDGFVINMEQDADPVVEANLGEYNQGDKRFGKGVFHKVARIPPVVWADLMRRGIAQDSEALKKWLNDRDNQLFKTKPVRL